MAIDSYKVSTTEVNTYNVKSAPDTLTSDAQTNKNWFDRLGEYFISKYNGLIDYLANNLTGRDGTGRGLKYEDGKVHWKYAVEPTDSFGFSYSGNIQPSDDGYDTPLTNDITLTVSDMMDCFLIVNNVEYQCEDAYQDGGLIRTKTYINGVEILLTYSTLSRDLVMSHATNPLDTTYWNVECYKSRADKVLAKSLPGNLTNAAYIELKDMIDRITGLTGKTITYTIIEYGVSNDEATPPAAWQPNPPATTQGQWLWVKSTTIFTDGSEETFYTKSYIGTDGEDGISVTVQSVEKHGTTTTIKLVDSDGNVSTITLEDGEDGDNGLPGANGYVHLAWANSADGSVDFSTSISYGKDYLGTYSDNTEADSQDYHDYSWTYIRGMQGEQGEPGEQGEDGVGVDKVQPQYALSTSKTTAPVSGWGDSLTYVSGYYIWTRDKITFADSTAQNPHIEYSDPVCNEALTDACRLANNTAQYFWVKSTGGSNSQKVPTGAYVTPISRDDYDITNPPTTTGNTLIRSDGYYIRTGYNTNAVFNGSGITIYNPSLSSASYDSTLGYWHAPKVATYLADGMRLYAGSSDRELAKFTVDGTNFTNEKDVSVFDVKYKATSNYNNRLDTFPYSNSTTFTMELPWAIRSGTSVSSFTFYDNFPSEISTSITTSGHYSVANNTVTFDSTLCTAMRNAGVTVVGVKYSATGRFPNYTIGTRADNTDTNSGNFSVAIGENNIARANTSVCIGDSNKATGINSVAGGLCSEARGFNCFAFGKGTAAGWGSGALSAELAIGEYNTVLTSYQSRAFVIGNGSADNARSDAFTVDYSGNVTATGAITAGGFPSGLTTQKVDVSFTNIAANSAEETTKTVTKAGYYPLGVVGFSVANGSLAMRRCYLSAQSTGSCTVTFNVRNVSSSAVSSSDASAYILWAKS